MDIGSWIELVTAATLIVGVIFAAVQLRQIRVNREREATLELVHSFETPEFARAVFLLAEIPDDLSKKELEGRLGADIEFVYPLLTTWEALGILVYRGEVTLDLVDDFFSGPLVVSWRKLHGFMDGARRELGRDTYGEWFQWLAERMEERESSSPPVPAHIEYADWHPDRSVPGP